MSFHWSTPVEALLGTHQFGALLGAQPLLVALLGAHQMNCKGVARLLEGPFVSITPSASGNELLPHCEHYPSASSNEFHPAPSFVVSSPFFLLHVPA
ncbi:hypothetical protein U1Q18_022451, partial [Sarracenia purpurea var. burkii]